MPNTRPSLVDRREYSKPAATDVTRRPGRGRGRGVGVRCVAWALSRPKMKIRVPCPPRHTLWLSPVATMSTAHGAQSGFVGALMQEGAWGAYRATTFSPVIVKGCFL